MGTGWGFQGKPLSYRKLEYGAALIAGYPSTLPTNVYHHEPAIKPIARRLSTSGKERRLPMAWLRKKVM